MDRYEEAISKKKIAIDILLEYKTNIAIEWFSNKDVDDFVGLETYEDYGDLCFKYLNNEYKIVKGHFNNFKKDDHMVLSLYFNKERVLSLHYIEKGKTYNKFNWSDHNLVQELRLYDWVEELPVIMNEEKAKAKAKKTRYQIKNEKEQEKTRLEYVRFIDDHFSLGKYADPNSKDYKNYLSFKEEEEEKRLSTDHRSLRWEDMNLKDDNGKKILSYKDLSKLLGNYSKNHKF